MKPIPQTVDSTTKMNKTETRYAEMLELLKRAGEIVEWRFEGIKFKLGEDRCWYTPDFFVVGPEAFEIHEIKGGFIHSRDMVRFKTAAHQYPWFEFRMVQWKGKKWSRLHTLNRRSDD